MLHRRKFTDIVVALQKEEEIHLHMLAMLSRVDYMRLKRIIENEVVPNIEEASSILQVFNKSLIIE